MLRSALILRGGLLLSLCFLSTAFQAGSKPVSQKNVDNFAASFLLSADAPAAASPSATDTRVALLAAKADYSPNFCATAQQLRHWTKTVVTVRVVVSEAESKRGDTAALVVKGMALWNVRTAPYLTLVPTDAENADITISFVPAGSLTGHAVGQTDVRFRLADQILTRATIRINEKLSDAQLTQVAAHELGHALGIQGHSTDPRDLMFTHAHIPAQITDRDANTMFVSYGIAARNGVALPGGAICTTPSATGTMELPADDDTGTK